jgi:hypothetical protein
MARHMSDLQYRETRLRNMLQRIVDANEEFRAQLPRDWEGDPLDDLCQEAKILLNPSLYRAMPR